MIDIYKYWEMGFMIVLRVGYVRLVHPVFYVR